MLILKELHLSCFSSNRDFYCGYSPERINPGDKEHRVDTILKVTSGSTPEVAETVDRLYGSIISAGTHKAASIKVAEAAKVIENTQRDINIAFVNELAVMFDKMGLDTREVLEAAGTKWNFLPFKPGLVGGHCIGVDPYYLTYKAQELGHNPEMILAGRRLNDGMGAYVAEQTVKGMIKKGHTIYGVRVLVLGITFKENCPDIRNSKVIDVVRGLEDFGCRVEVYDPLADPEEVQQEYGLHLIEAPESGAYGGIVCAVGHKEFEGLEVTELGSEKSYVYDVRGFLPRETVDKRL
jgi:UDP-N-acetyl-D-galactosamine dehydrogenase